MSTFEVFRGIVELNLVVTNCKVLLYELLGVFIKIQSNESIYRKTIHKSLSKCSWIFLHDEIILDVVYYTLNARFILKIPRLEFLLW